MIKKMKSIVFPGLSDQYEVNGMPDVTQQDNGKLAGVVNGAWQAVEAPKSSVQPDWDQNDSTASDYVKNRPFYTGDPVETVIFPEQTLIFTVDAETGGGSWEGSADFSLTIGEEYNVNWDGVGYKCIVVDDFGYFAMGNTGDPFLISVGSSDGSFFINAFDENTAHAVSITSISTTVVKIPTQYIPLIPEESIPAVCVRGKILPSTNIVGSGESKGSYMFASIAQGFETEKGVTKALVTGTFTVTYNDYSNKIIVDGVYEAQWAENGQKTIIVMNHKVIGTITSGVRTENVLLNFIQSKESQGINVSVVNNIATVNVSCDITVTPIVSIDSTLMPIDTIVTSPNGKQFKLTVDDTGTISATEVTT